MKIFFIFLTTFLLPKMVLADSEMAVAKRQFSAGVPTVVCGDALSKKFEEDGGINQNIIWITEGKTFKVQGTLSISAHPSGARACIVISK